MQQRVALARAVVNRPDVLLLDEPLGALDLKLRRQMQIELKRIQQEVGLTFIHVTHDQEEAMTMADTVAVMNHGRIEQMDAPEILYDLPRSAFVANFVGQSNLGMARVVDRDGDDLVADVAGTQVRIPVARSARDRRRHLLRHPPREGRASTRTSPTAPATTSAATVLDVSFTGVATQYLVRLPSGVDVGRVRAEPRRRSRTSTVRATTSGSRGTRHTPSGRRSTRRRPGGAPRRVG